MGVYVKGMDMPKDCPMCPMAHYNKLDEFTGCEIVPGKKYEMMRPEYANSDCRPDWCPLVEVPTPHGRLIDADALETDLKRQCKEVFRADAVSPDDYWITRNQAYNENLWKTWCESFYDYLKTRPIIIPTEESE